MSQSNTSNRWENHPHKHTPSPPTQHDTSISSLLNDQDDYLPTPVTPASANPLQQRNQGDGFGSFALERSKRSSDDTSKPYACHVCDQTFSRPHNLKSHLATHSSERPFQCEECQYHFRRHHDLKRHQKKHTGQKPFVCHVCDRSFARRDALTRHTRAEGGTACSAVHSKYATPQSGVSQRPIIPQLNIPHPASQRLPTVHASPSPSPVTSPPPLPHSSTQAASQPPSSSAQQPSNRGHVLPSPSALSSLPMNESTSLTPIYHPTKTPSPPPYRAWASQSPTLAETLEQENKHLKEEIARLQDQSELERLKARVHDLEVENNVLRSLITGEQNSKRPRSPDAFDPIPAKKLHH